MIAFLIYLFIYSLSRDHWSFNLLYCDGVSHTYWYIISIGLFIFYLKGSQVEVTKYRPPDKGA